MVFSKIYNPVKGWITESFLTNDEIYKRAFDQDNVDLAQHMVDRQAHKMGFHIYRDDTMQWDEKTDEVGSVMHYRPRICRRPPSEVRGLRKPNDEEKAFWHGTKDSNKFNVFSLIKSKEGFHFGARAVALSRTIARDDTNVNRYYLKGTVIDVRDLECNDLYATASQLLQIGKINEDTFNELRIISVQLSSVKSYTIQNNTWGTWGHTPLELDIVGIIRKHIPDLVLRYINEYDCNIKENEYSYMVYDPALVKKADPFTFDNGELIPLSQRFGPSNDVRY